MIKELIYFLSETRTRLMPTFQSKYGNTATVNFLRKYEKPLRYSCIMGAGAGAGSSLTVSMMKGVVNYGCSDLPYCRDAAKAATIGAVLFGGAALTTCLLHKGGKATYFKAVEKGPKIIEQLRNKYK